MLDISSCAQGPCTEGKGDALEEGRAAIPAVKKKAQAQQQIKPMCLQDAHCTMNSNITNRTCAVSAYPCKLRQSLRTCINLEPSSLPEL
eukprot:406019-Pelagomonas_calceolata.AAC.3